jgi:transcriptional regulator with XRE-family HTH domain
VSAWNSETVQKYHKIGFSRLFCLTSPGCVSHTETVPKRFPVGFKMPRPLQFNDTAPFAVRDGALRLGERLALARKRRRLTLRELAAKAGISYDTARAAEAGNLQTGLGAYLAMLWAMGLESEINSFVDPDRDETGKQFEIARQPRRVAHRKEKHDDDF